MRRVNYLQPHHHFSGVGLAILDSPGGPDHILNPTMIQVITVNTLSLGAVALLY